MLDRTDNELSASASVIELGMILVLLCAAFFMQFFYNELPCPLCLLQRIGFLGIAFGLLLNISYGVKPLHYGISMLSALFTMVVSVRQVFLHIAPGSGSYGPPVFGLHLYTWSFIAAAFFMFLNIALVVLAEPLKRFHVYHEKAVAILKHLAFLLLFIVAVANTVTTFMECGFGQCPDNPVKYQYTAGSDVRPGGGSEFQQA